jgi:hypothetical protein
VERRQFRVFGHPQVVQARAPRKGLCAGSRAAPRLRRSRRPEPGTGVITSVSALPAGAAAARVLDRLVVRALDVEGVDRDAALGPDPGEGDVEPKSKIALASR